MKNIKNNTQTLQITVCSVQLEESRFSHPLANLNMLSWIKCASRVHVMCIAGYGKWYLLTLGN